MISCTFTHIVQPPAGSYVYSGRHDHGVLLPPRHTDGTMAHMIAAVQKAKEASNKYLTNIIVMQQQQQQKKQQQEDAATSPLAKEPSTKRTKVNPDQEDE